MFIHLPHDIAKPFPTLFQIKHFLFRRNMPFGGDLRAFDIQRNRDHGLASYNDLRQFCGLRKAITWKDLTDLIDLDVSHP